MIVKETTYGFVFETFSSQYNNRLAQLSGTAKNKALTYHRTASFDVRKLQAAARGIDSMYPFLARNLLELKQYCCLPKKILQIARPQARPNTKQDTTYLRTSARLQGNIPVSSEQNPKGNSVPTCRLYEKTYCQKSLYSADLQDTRLSKCTIILLMVHR